MVVSFFIGVFLVGFYPIPEKEFEGVKSFFQELKENGAGTIFQLFLSPLLDTKWEYVKIYSFLISLLIFQFQILNFGILSLLAKLFLIPIFIIIGFMMGGEVCYPYRIRDLDLRNKERRFFLKDLFWGLVVGGLISASLTPFQANPLAWIVITMANIICLERFLKSVVAFSLFLLDWFLNRLGKMILAKRYNCIDGYDDDEEYEDYEEEVT
jgi:hypothetical protein